MTLLVSAFWRDADTGQVQRFTDWSDGHYMAGVESARRELWGSDAVRRRGARYLPRLADSDLRVEPEELHEFVAEVQRLLGDLDGLRKELERGPNCSLPHYLNNFVRAAEYARARGGGINIA